MEIDARKGQEENRASQQTVCGALRVEVKAAWGECCGPAPPHSPASPILWEGLGHRPSTPRDEGLKC